jgi:hypothetical protein
MNGPIGFKPSNSRRTQMPNKRWQLSKLSLLALAGLIVVSAGSAVAQELITGKQIRNGTIRSEDLSKSLRKRIGNTYAAKVGGDGSLIAGRGVRSAARAAAGDFQVVFRRSVDRCAAVATPRGTSEVEFHGFVTTYSPSAAAIRVVIRRPNGELADAAGFNLVVSC